MVLERFRLVRNVGQFDSVDAGAQLPLTPFTLIYAENGRGKTTLATILRSLSTGDAEMIAERHRLGAQHPPHIILTVAGGPVIFENGAWPGAFGRVAVYDDAFVSANVCSGIEIDPSHRQNLHELILGAQGVALNGELQRHVGEVEEHNRAIRAKETAIPAAQRQGLAVDAFCALPADPEIDAHIQAAERAMAAAQSADAIRQQGEFLALSLPRFDVAAIQAVLARGLPELQVDAAAQVRAHLRRLGRGGEAWVSEGMTRLAAASAETGVESCPFCAQSLEQSALITHYEAYFSDAYEGLKTAIREAGTGIAAAHGGDIPVAFERATRMAVQNREFWRGFLDVPEVDLDTAAVVRDWTAAREAVLTVLRAKAASPLEAMALDQGAIAAVDRFHLRVETVDALSSSLVARNAQIAIVKEQAASANAAALGSDLARLRAIQLRHSEPLNAACNEYLAEKDAKARTEGLRDRARGELDQYRTAIFPAYETAINDFLGRFGAGFRLGGVGSVNTRGGSSASYNVVINNVPVGLAANGGPSFRTTLSAGDRNTLALAFFFASLEQDPDRAQKIVVIDDPMTSLDEHRSIRTVQEVRGLSGRVGQVIVLSHSKSFLCALWDGADSQTRSALRINRAGAGSTLAAWDVSRDCVTEHDRRHELVRGYMVAANPDIEREVAQALRHIIEAYLRVAYPAHFPPETNIGPFLNNVCRPRLGRGDEVLNVADVTELDRLRDYANRFHHDTNPAWQTVAINDQELADMSARTLRFASRG